VDRGIIPRGHHGGIADRPEEPKEGIENFAVEFIAGIVMKACLVFEPRDHIGDPSGIESKPFGHEQKPVPPLFQGLQHSFVFQSPEKYIGALDQPVDLLGIAEIVKGLDPHIPALDIVSMLLGIRLQISGGGDRTC
jgi:hypothetical protein